jgi:hypothetical protein
VDRKLLTELQAFARSPKLDEWIENGIARAKAKRTRETDDELSQLQAQIRAQEHQVAKATDILFQVGVSEALKSRPGSRPRRGSSASCGRGWLPPPLGSPPTPPERSPRPTW